MEIARVLSRPHWISLKMMKVDVFLVRVFSLIEVWKWYSCVSFLACENNHNFSGKNLLLGYQLLGLILSYNQIPYFQPETQGCFLWTNQHWPHIWKFSFLGLPNASETLEFHDTCKPFLPFCLDLAQRSMESELESQGPACQMNAISWCLRCCCFPFKQKWKNTEMNFAHAKI